MAELIKGARVQIVAPPHNSRRALQTNEVFDQTGKACMAFPEPLPPRLTPMDICFQESLPEKVRVPMVAGSKFFWMGLQTSLSIIVAVPSSD